MNRRRRRLISAASTLAMIVLAGVVVQFAIGRYRFIRVPRVPIERISVRDHNTHSATVGTDPARIQRSIEFLKARRLGWTKTWVTFPTPRYDVLFESHGTIQYVVCVSDTGPPWIGFRNYKKPGPANLLKDISSTERSEFLKDLGLR